LNVELAMRYDVDEALKSNVMFSSVLADRIFRSAGEDVNDALLKAVGTLALVIEQT